MKEEGDLSHINQAYDDKVIKSDKPTSGKAINMLKNFVFNFHCGVLDEYSLIHAVLYANKCTKPEVWVQSFHKVNLQPSTRVDFDAWCECISEALKSGTAFQRENLKTDKYELL